MNKYIDNLRIFLSEQSPRYGYDDANTLLEMLYYFYTEENPIDSGVIRLHFKALEEILSKLPQQDNNAFFALVCSLCENCQKKAFMEGLLVGLRLFSELDALNTGDQ